MVNYSEMIQDCAKFNVRSDLKHLTYDEIQKIQPKRNFSVACLNVTGDLNIGVICRNALICGAKKVWIIGRRKFDKRSTVGVENYLEIEQISSLESDGITIKDNFMDFLENPIFVEYTKTSVCFDEFSCPTEPCFIFGNEGTGIPEWLIQAHPRVPIVHLDMFGTITRSYNVSSCAAILLYNYVKSFDRK